MEGVLRRIADNQGERLTIGNDEAMSFYMGTGAHHQGAGTSLMTDAVCRMYDWLSYSKDLVNERNSYHIAKCLGTMLMTTVFEKFSGWEGFKIMVSSGAMSRTTVGMMSTIDRAGFPLAYQGCRASHGGTVAQAAGPAPCQVRAGARCPRCMVGVHRRTRGAQQGHGIFPRVRGLHALVPQVRHPDHVPWQRSCKPSTLQRPKPAP